jgi:hypothetical protein
MYEMSRTIGKMKMKCTIVSLKGTGTAVLDINGMKV